jgi:hypothetical protein
MKAQVSRESHRPRQRYSGVYHIQGAMVTDADLDEHSTIARERTDNLGDDGIKDGVPAVGGAVTMAEDGAVSLGAGVIYADGIRGVLQAADGEAPEGPLEIFSAQADLPLGPVLPADGKSIVYADIWERPVFPLEDPYLADPGLHGAITGFRTRTMTQLKAAPAELAPNIENGTGAFPRIGTGLLQVTPLNAEILADECDPCAEVVSAEQQIANALWRLEVIAIAGTPDNPSHVVLAWSEENAAEIAPATVSPELFERANKVYEFFSPITESRAGVFADAGDARRSAFVDDLAATPNPSKNHDGLDWPFVRRWDGVATIDMNAAAIDESMGGGFDVSMSGRELTLRVGAFEAVLDLANAAVVPGDYWLVELRRHAPETERIRLVQQTPVGILHRFCTLVTVEGGQIDELTDAQRRKLSFPALSDLPADHVGFDNNCEKLYGDAENIQEALDNLCSITAADIAFDSNCPVLYDDAKTVQEALDALCRVDFSVQDSFRLLFDWGVLCGIVPKKAAQSEGTVSISPGAYLDRSGRLTKFDGVELDLGALKIGKGIVFDSEALLHAALVKGEACLALAGADGGETTFHVVPKAIAFGPADPGFDDRVKACVAKRKIIRIDDVLATLPESQKAAANKIFFANTGGGAFHGSARLTRAEFSEASKFHRSLVGAFEKVAEPDDVEMLKARIEEAKKEIPTENLSGSALEIRQMQQAAAVVAVYVKTDLERLQRCICESLFPTCPPNPGTPPFFVPIACLRGSYDGRIFVQEVCAYCCRKQAMTWRSVQYFVGDVRERLAARFSAICCADHRKVPRPDLIYDPDRFAMLDLVRFAEDYDLLDTVLDRPKKLPSDFKVKVAVNDLSIDDARSMLKGTGVDVAEVIDVNDAKAFETIEARLTGVTATDLLVAGSEVRPGDKVGLLVQEGLARGYVLLERGSGKLPFEATRGTLAIDDEAKGLLEGLIRDTAAARDELGDLQKVRETLVADIGGLKDEVAELTKDRDVTVETLKDVRTQLTDLAKIRKTLSAEIEATRKELQAADDNRKAMTAAMREVLPVTAVLGNESGDVLVKLAGEGITTVGDMSRLTAAKIRRLSRAGILEEADAKALKTKAADLLKRT